MIWSFQIRIFLSYQVPNPTWSRSDTFVSGRSLILRAYYSLQTIPLKKVPVLPLVPGSVFGHNKDSPPPQLRETKKKLACSTSINNNNNSLLSTSNSGSRTHSSNNSSGVKAARSVQNVSAAERSYSISDQQQQQQSRSHAVHRTPHRTAGYGGAGQPSRGPHR